MNNEKITKFLMDTLQPKIFKKSDCIAFTTENHLNSTISYLPKPSGKLLKCRILIRQPIRTLRMIFVASPSGISSEIVSEIFKI